MQKQIWSHCYTARALFLSEQRKNCIAMLLLNNINRIYENCLVVSGNTYLLEPVAYFRCVLTIFFFCILFPYFVSRNTFNRRHVINRVFQLIFKIIMPSTCEFELNNPNGVYFSGDTIIGTVILTTTSPKEVRGGCLLNILNHLITSLLPNFLKRK